MMLIGIATLTWQTCRKKVIQTSETVKRMETRLVGHTVNKDRNMNSIPMAKTVSAHSCMNWDI